MTLSSATLNACLIVLVCASLCALVLALLLRTGLAWRLALDQPNARSLHTAPTPRCGGWGMVPVIVAAILFSAWPLWPLMVGMSALAVMSYLDDRGGLPAGMRFIAHAVTVILVLALTGQDLPLWVLIIITLAWVWAINLYNFMDGADGLAGTMTLTGFGTYATAAAGHDPQAVLAACAAVGASLGFLYFNRPPAKLFLGDVGSIPIGFFAAGLGFTGWSRGLWPFWFPFLAFSPFVADASVTLLKRLARREKIWEAHRQHYYQRMIRSGSSHARTTAIWSGFMVTGGALAVGLLKQDERVQFAGIVAWGVVLLIAGILVDRRWQRFEQTRLEQEKS